MQIMWSRERDDCRSDRFRLQAVTRTYYLSVSPGVPCLSLPERNAHDIRGGCPHDTRTKTGATSVPLTELPFGFPGRIFRSPMPFGPYDLPMPCDETTHP